MKKALRLRSVHSGFVLPLLLLIIGLLVGSGAVYFLTKSKPIIPPTTSDTSDSSKSIGEEKFDPSKIVYSVDFTDSSGKNKKLIVIKTHSRDLDKIVLAGETYITEENLSRNTAVLIPALSQTAPDAPQGFLVASDETKIYVSPGTGKKYIIVDYPAIGSGSFMTLIDEKGNVINENISKIITSYSGYECSPCSWSTQKWNSNSDLTVKVTAIDLASKKPDYTFSDYLVHINPLAGEVTSSQKI